VGSTTWARPSPAPDIQLVAVKLRSLTIPASFGLLIIVRSKLLKSGPSGAIDVFGSALDHRRATVAYTAGSATTWITLHVAASFRRSHDERWANTRSFSSFGRLTSEAMTKRRGAAENDYGKYNTLDRIFFKDWYW
jgi:hypothetical protein